MHITASVFINDDERGLHANYEDCLKELAPHEPIRRYRHSGTGHLLRSSPIKSNVQLDDRWVGGRGHCPAPDASPRLISFAGK